MDSGLNCGHCSAGVRPVTLDDRLVVTQICGGDAPRSDYIPALFDAWVTDTDAHFFGITDACGSLAAIARCSLRDGGVTAWCEAVRVRADVRGRGLGRRLLEHAQEWAHGHDAGRLRAAVGTGNVPSQRLFAAAGFYEAARFDRWFASPARSGRLPRPLPLDELDAGFSLIQRFAPLRLTHGTYACGWSIFDLTLERLAHHCERQEALLAGDSMGAIALVHHFKQGDSRPLVALLCGAPVAMTRLLRGIRMLAHLRGLPEVQVTAAAGTGLDGLLAHCGFQQQQTGYITLQERIVSSRRVE